MFWSLISLMIGINGFVYRRGVLGKKRGMSISLMLGDVDSVVRNGAPEISK